MINTERLATYRFINNSKNIYHHQNSM